MLNPQEIRSPFPIVRCQLAGGVQLIWVQRPGLLRKMAYWTVPVGSGQQLLPDNADGHILLPAGVAHFLEHQLFREEDGSSISDAFAALGAQDNAFTYFDQTGYGFRCTANFPQALRLLLSFTAHPFIDEESVATEREIINQELLMYRDYPDSVLDLNLRHALFGHHPAGEDIAGTPESLNQITPELLRSCHRAFYHPSRAVLVIIGDLTLEEITEAAREAYASLEAREKPGKTAWELPLSLPLRATGAPFSSSTSYGMHLPRPLVALGFKEEQPEKGGLPLLKRQLESELLLDLLCGKSSDGYWRLYSQGLLNNTFTAGYYASPIFAYARLGGETDSPEALVEALTALLFNEGEGFIQEEALQRLKRGHLGEYVAAFEGFEDLAMELTAAHFYDYRVEDIPQLLQQMDVADLKERYRQLIRREQLTIATVVKAT